MTSPIRLHTRETGAGFPILCLHGHPGSSQAMDVFTSSLARHYRAIAPDLRGYGKTSASQPFDMADHLTDLQALLHRLSIQRCVLLGWSLGGILAMELTLRLPEHIDGLILIGTAARPIGAHPPVTWQDNAFTVLSSGLNWLWPGETWHIEPFGTRSLYRHLVRQHTPAVYQRLAQEGIAAYRQTSPLATQALQRALRKRYNRLADLHQIQCPTLMMAGAEDVHITAQASLETATHFPNCETRLYPNTAHLFPWEISDQVLADIHQWLEGLELKSDEDGRSPVPPPVANF